MSEPIKLILRFILFVLVQALVLNNMPPIHRFIIPYVYFLYILWLPFSMKRNYVLFVSFLLGFSLDIFLKTPGLNAAACVLVGYFRAFLISLLVPRETKELNNGSPSVRSMGITSYAIYIIISALVHFIWLTILDWMNIDGLGYFTGKVLLSTLYSVVLIAIIELLFRPIRKRDGY